MTGSRACRFGPFILDIDERRLSAGGDTIRLSPKAFEVLATLVQHRARLLTKHELLARVWPDVFVDEGILTVHVAALRKALNDDPRRPSYIETVPGTGYRFVAALERDVEDECSPSLDPPRPVDLYELVGRGRLHLLSASHTQLPLAVDAFRAAVARDPTYAPAHAGLARARCTQAVLRAAPHQDAFADAKASALRALTLDSGSADAHVALGTVQFLAEWNWSEAERSLQRALRVNPDHTEALLQYGSLHDALGRLDEGLQLKQRALTRDPRSPLVLVHIALSYSHQRKYEEALVWARRALEIDASHLLASVFVAFIYWTLGDLDGFIAENIRAALARHVPEEGLASLKEVHARMRQMHAAKGFAGWSQCMADEISNQNAGDLSSMASRRAVLYAAAGRLDQAFACLDDAIGARDPAIVYLGVAPQWDALRGDRRFADRLHAISLDADR